MVTFGRTPFILHPVLREGNDLLPISCRVLEQHLRWFPFGVARSLGFADTVLATAVENYVADLLDTLKLEYTREPRTGTDAEPGKSPDFVLPFEGGRLLLEVKATDLPELPAVLGDPQVLYNALESSIVKAVTQLLEFAHRSDPENGIETFALVVTPWELDLGPFPNLWEHSLRPGVLGSLAALGFDGSSIPPNRIWLVSMRELEVSLQIAAASESTLWTALKQAAIADLASNTQRFCLRQHLPEEASLPLPELVRRAEIAFWHYAGSTFHDFDPSRIPIQ